MNKILLIIPKIVPRGNDYTFPVGAAYVAAALKAAGFMVDCLNLSHHDESLPAVIQKKGLNLSQYILCGTAGLSPQFAQVENIVSTVRRLNPALPVMVGGGLVSSLPEVSVNELKADFGVLGEGEITAVELARTLSGQTHQIGVGGRVIPAGHTHVRNVAGLVVRDRNNGAVFRTAERPPIEDLDSVPFPDLDAFDFGEMLSWQLPTSSLFTYYFDNPRLAPLIASRSCPFNCTFCYHPLGRKYRQRSLENIFQEVDVLIAKYQINILMVYDELFALKSDMARTVKFCEGMKQRNLKWIVQLRVDSISPSLLALFKDCGCIMISYGIESGSDTILKSMQKHTTVAQVEKALYLSKRAGIGVTGTVLFGDANETPDTFWESFTWWLNMRQHKIALTPIYILPGSQLYNVAKARGIIKNEAQYLKVPYPIINNTLMSHEQYVGMLNLVQQGQSQGRGLLGYYPGLLLRAAAQGKDRFGRELHYIEAKCPHCRQVNIYRNMQHNPGQVNYLTCGCRNCNGRYDIPLLKN
jgi:radical SAM superfamily enzyme YgiQ (UPF0313 family)